MTRAGRDVRIIKQFWSRMERLRSGGESPETDVTHPTTAESSGRIRNDNQGDSGEA